VEVAFAAALVIRPVCGFLFLISAFIPVFFTCLFLLSDAAVSFRHFFVWVCSFGDVGSVDAAGVSVAGVCGIGGWGDFGIGADSEGVSLCSGQFLFTDGVIICGLLWVAGVVFAGRVFSAAGFVTLGGVSGWLHGFRVACGASEVSPVVCGDVDGVDFA
jgi:hypothetical protein